MDDLYDNLENYNDVNIIEEIKNENKELKTKLDEYSKAMAQLQKDFDKVNTEYKNLQKNYSSLIKTARAEIERKTETIKKLNVEKDMFVIQTLQKTGRNILNSARSRFNSQEKDTKNLKSSDKVVNKGNQYQEKSTNNNCEKEKRVDSNYMTSLDTVSTASVDNKSICSDEKGVDKNIVNSNENNNYKRNLLKESHKDDTTLTATRNNKIIKRRKSIAAMGSQEPKFSSDEDGERMYADIKRRSPRPRNNSKYERQDPRDHRTAELCNSNLLKESHRINPHKHSDYEKHRNVGQYDSYQRPWRPYSPERNQRRYNKEYDNYHVRGDYGNQRVLRSPPSDKYNRSKSRDRRFHNFTDDYRDFDKHSNRFHDHSSMNKRIRKEFDEPNSKKRKLDSYSTCTKESIDYVKDGEQDISEKLKVSPLQEYFESSTCQSPDHISVDANIPQHRVKEIMITAKTTLEDPRKSSKKYIFKTCNDIISLTTVVGRDIDLKCVDKSVWGIESVDVPKTLSQPPDQGSDNMLKEIYMDLDNADLNESFELVEMHNVEDDLATFYSKEIVEDYENKIKEENESSVCETKNDTIADGKVNDSTKPSGKSVISKFKIPKIKKIDNSDVEKDSNRIDTNISKTSLEKLKDPMKNSSSKNSNFTVGNESLGKKNELFTPNVQQKHVSDKENNKKYGINDTESLASGKSDINKTRQEIMSTIEGDLELSDEASDVIDLHKDIDYNLSEKEPKALLNIDKASTDSGSLKENKPNSRKNNKIKTKEAKIKTSTSRRVSKKEKDSPKESSKKQKSKRKSAEHKHKKSEDKIQHKEDTVKKLEKTECNQSISKQTTSKFSDLFGDSNSLITPDDLGINNVQEQPADKYTYIFDNTQDAIDLNINDITKKHLDTKVENTFETVPNELNHQSIDNTNRFSVNVTVVNGNDERSPEDKNITLNGVYENTKSETLAESSIVKTVIISSGIQPEPVITTGNSTSSNIPSVIPIADMVLVKKCPMNSIKALATSTPQKTIENNSLLTDTAFTTNVNKSTEVSVSNTTDSSNLNNTSELQTEEDIPDVRIFVRRRRKIIKKFS